jgi:hypothetical protein
LDSRSTIFGADIEFGVEPLKISSVPCALVGVHSVDQLAFRRRDEKLSLPNAVASVVPQ